MNDPICQRCGKCCFLWDEKGPTNEPCKMLIKLKSGKTLCRIYKNRLGYKPNNYTICIMRQEMEVDIPECPYNSGKKIHEGVKV